MRLFVKIPVTSSMRRRWFGAGEPSVGHMLTPVHLHHIHLLPSSQRIRLHPLQQRTWWKVSQFSSLRSALIDLKETTHMETSREERTARSRRRSAARQEVDHHRDSNVWFPSQPSAVFTFTSSLTFQWISSNNRQSGCFLTLRLSDSGLSRSRATGNVTFYILLFLHLILLQ